MARYFFLSCSAAILQVFGLVCLESLSVRGFAQERAAEKSIELGSYEYEAKPDDEAFAKFNPRKAPPIGPLLLRKGDKLAICGDSITEQKMYSRIIETYLTVCVPELEITARQYGWSGEKTDGFLRRMEQDCLTFQPSIATLCYGMNDARYRPFDVTNGKWYEDHYSAIVRKFRDAGTRVIVGSPGASGRLATWVKSRSGTLDEHNLNLCCLRDIAIEVAKNHDAAFADIFWPMYQAKIFGERKYSTAAEKYEVAGKDGIHPGWAGQLIMAYAFLRAMGLDGDLGAITIDLRQNKAEVSKHELLSFRDRTLSIRSHRYPYCAEGPEDNDNSIRSGMTLVPFNEQLNRLTLRVLGLGSRQAMVVWGDSRESFTRDQLEQGINLAAEFPTNPFSVAFQKVDQAVFEKQAYETEQIKKIFHGPLGRSHFEQVVTETERKRQPLAEAIQSSFLPVTHTLRVEEIP